MTNFGKANACCQRLSWQEDSISSKMAEVSALVHADFA
jgi:hypothetical protein